MDIHCTQTGRLAQAPKAEEQRSASAFFYPYMSFTLIHDRRLTFNLDADSNFPIFQDPAGHLRVRVYEGEVITKTLRPGEMNYLTAIEDIQDGKHHRKLIDEESAALLNAHCSMTPSEININPLDPFLFAKATGTTKEEQQEFYSNVWILFNHCTTPVMGISQQLCDTAIDKLSLKNSWYMYKLNIHRNHKRNVQLF